QLYGPTGATKFITADHTPLAFLYPPIAAILFTGLAMVSLPAASAIITAISLVVLTLGVYLVLDGLDVWPDWTVTGESAALRRAWLALLITAVASFQLDPIWSNYGYGQINVVPMVLVLADCLPRRTLWPRGVLVGLAIALKLTAAVMIPYFMIKRDWRAVATTCASFVAVTAVGFVFAWRDSVDFWMGISKSASRVANIGLNTNESLYAFLSRLSMDGLRGPLWLVCSAVMLAVTVWATRRAVAAGYDALAVCCVALLGLLASPISWTHHWVWVLPACISTAVVGYRERQLVLLAVTAAGLAVAKWPTLEMLPSGREWTAPLWSQLVGVSYVWWALA
ncbi:MAG: glycosyltransferase 87 family protein, partial [Mycobacterium sp.]